jgi:hypothetical protein
VEGKIEMTEEFIVIDDGEKLRIEHCQQLLPVTEAGIRRALYEQTDWDGNNSELTGNEEVVLVAAKLKDDSLEGYRLIQMTRAEAKAIERSEQ